MRTKQEIQADLDLAQQGLTEAANKVERLKQEWRDTDMAERRAKPLLAEERAMLEKLSQKEKTDNDDLKKKENMYAHLLESRGFASLHATGWQEGYWQITDLGRKKLEEKP